jgi:predicted DCC family thiol-disulfide oxidoreductase YuxK
MFSKSDSVVFYDGDCGFCNRVVAFILKNEREPKILFSALQSDFAKEFFKENGATQIDMSTFYFFSNYSLYSKSAGVLALIPFLKWPFKLLNIYRILPICQRDQLYDLIAKRRKKIAGNYCFIPTEEQKRRFLIDG